MSALEGLSEAAWESALISRHASIRKVAPPQLSRRLADAFNHWYGLRQPLPLVLAGRSFWCRPVADATDPPERGLTLSLSINGLPAFLRLPHEVAGLVIRDLGGSHLPFADMPQDLLVALMEMAAAPWLDEIERMTGHQIRLTGLGHAADAAPMMMVEFAVQHDHGAVEFARLWCDEDSFINLASCWSNHRPKRRHDAPVPLSVTIRVGVTHLSTQALRALGRGDVVLMDRSLAQWGQGGVIVGEQRVYWANIKEGSLEIVTAGESLAIPDEGYWSMDTTMNEAMNGTELPETSPGVAADNAEMSRFDDLPVKIAFELGRVEITMAELQSLGVGSVLTTKRHLRSPVDILVNGRKIGLGEIIQVENELGVRLLKVFDHG